MPASELQTAAARLAACVEGLDQWMGSNRLKLNAEKIWLIWIGTMAKMSITHLRLISSVVEFVSRYSAHGPRRGMFTCIVVGLHGLSTSQFSPCNQHSKMCQQRESEWFGVEMN